MSEQLESAKPLFVFGTLMDTDVLQLVSGMELSALTRQPALARGFKRRRVQSESFPILIASNADSVSGLLVYGLNAMALQRTQFFEGDEYTLQPIQVDSLPGSHASMAGTGVIEAVFFADNLVYQFDDHDWSIEHWQAQYKEVFLSRIAHYMGFFGSLGIADADQHW